jgi:hypothetical protein
VLKPSTRNSSHLGTYPSELEYQWQFWRCKCSASGAATDCPEGARHITCISLDQNCFVGPVLRNPTISLSQLVGSSSMVLMPAATSWRHRHPDELQLILQICVGRYDTLQIVQMVQSNFVGPTSFGTSFSATVGNLRTSLSGTCSVGRNTPPWERRHRLAQPRLADNTSTVPAVQEAIGQTVAQTTSCACLVAEPLPCWHEHPPLAACMRNRSQFTHSD